MSFSRALFLLLVAVYAISLAVNRCVSCEPVCVIHIANSDDGCHSVSEWRSDLHCRLLEIADRLVHLNISEEDTRNASTRASVRVESQRPFYRSVSY